VSTNSFWVKFWKSGQMKFIFFTFSIINIFFKGLQNLGNYFKLYCPIKVWKSNAFSQNLKKLKCNFFVSEEVEVYPMTFLHQIKLFQFLTKILFQLSPLFLHQEPESPNQIFFGFGDVGQITIPKNQIGQIYKRLNGILDNWHIIKWVKGHSSEKLWNDLTTHL